MDGVTTRQTDSLFSLIDTDATTFDAALPKLGKEDLVRLVGLLQQSMLEEERRFSQLSQYLHALHSGRADAISHGCCPDDGRSPPRSLPRQDANNDTCCVRFRKPCLTNDELLCMKSVESTGQDGALQGEGHEDEEKTVASPDDMTETGDACLSKLSDQWDNAGVNSSTEADAAILRLRIGDDGHVGKEEIIFDDLGTEMRAEQERRDYLARELCLSQSRLAQLCSKNMNVYSVQQEVCQHRLRYELENRRLSTPTSSIPAGSSDHQHFTTGGTSSQEQQARKSLSALHKEKKLKELSEKSTDNSSADGAHKVDILRQQALHTVLAGIFEGAGDSAFDNGPAEISPESGYNSSSSLKSPSFSIIPAVDQSSTSHCQIGRVINQNQQRPAKQNEIDLSASRQRILDQVRSRRSSAPPNQHLIRNSSPRPQADQHRPLKSILKKRATDIDVSRSVENGIGRNDQLDFLSRKCAPVFRSSSCSDETACKGICNTSSEMDEKRKDIRILNYATESQLGERLSEDTKRISMSDTMTSPIRPRLSPAPVMADRQGPSPTAHLHDRDSPVSYPPPVNYPSPAGTGSSEGTGGGQGDLPDVVMLKIGEGAGMKQFQTSHSSNGDAQSMRQACSPQKVQPSAVSPDPGEPKPVQTRGGLSKEGSPENDVFRQWDPRPLIRELYTVRYEGRPEEKRQRFVNMEGTLEHLPMNIRAMVATETMWRTHYFRTKEGRLQWFEDISDPLPFGEMTLAGAEVDVDKNTYTVVLKNAVEGQLLTIRYPPHLLDKWRSALLSHASASSTASFVKPVYPPIANSDESVCVIEIGSCSIRAGLLTSEPSLPQTYFPSIACVLPNGTIVPGFDALSPSVRHEGTLVHPITPTQPAVNRYCIDLEIVKHLFRNAFQDLRIDPGAYQVMLSVPQNAPVAMVGDMMRTLLVDFGVRGVFVSKQPFLVLYAYDVTTGVVVDFGDRLNIVPVIDGYVVQSAIVSLPLGGYNVSEGLKTKLIERNWTPYSFMSKVEKYILRYVMEKACYVASDFDEEAESYDRDPSQINTYVSIEQFKPPDDMSKGYDVDASRFTCPEGIFKPKRWGFDIDGLHKLIYHAIQGSPLDSRRVLYRNIYLAGGASLIGGLAERLELELARLVASSVQVRVRTSPWRDHAAYIGAQILSGGIQFEQQLIKDTEELEKFIRRLYAANF